MRHLAICLLLVLWSSVSYAGSFSIFQVSSAVNGTAGAFVPMNIGPGGQLSQPDDECDQGWKQCNNSGTVTKVEQTDTYGAWIWSQATGWYQAVTYQSMPTGVTAGSSTYSFPVYGIRIAPSNTNDLYMFYQDGCIYSSTNKGVKWTKTAFTCLSANMGGGPQKFMAPTIDISPTNPSVVFVNTPSNGVFYTLNGGTSWVAISTGTIPAGTQAYGNLVRFDWSDATGNTLYATSYGSASIYKITSATTSPSVAAITGAPATISALQVDLAGGVWVIDNSVGGFQPAGAINKYASGSWSQVLGSSNNPSSLAVDYNHCSSLTICTVTAIMDNGALNTTTNGGSTWTGANENFSRAATDYPWLATTNESYMTAGGVVYNPAGSNLIDFPEGLGNWNTNPPSNSSNPYVYTSQSQNIQQLVSNRILSIPGAGVYYMADDRSMFPNINPKLSPTQDYCSPTSQAIQHGWDVDYAQTNSSILWAICNSAGADTSGYSLDGGNTWTAFPSNLPYSAGGGRWGGSGATTDGSVGVWAPGDGQFIPYYSLNRGTAWAQITLPGTVDDCGGVFGQLNHKNVEVDRVTAGTFYMYCQDRNTGQDWVLTSTGNNPASWSIVCTWCQNGSSVALFPFADGVFQVKLQTVPGQAGYMLLGDLCGQLGGGSNCGAAGLLYISTNGGATWTDSGLTDVGPFGLGASCSGATFSFFAFATKSAVTAMWRGDYSAGTITYTQLSGAGGDSANPSQNLNGSLDSVSEVSGDMNTCNTVYYGFAGSGAAFRTNWLLNRDINPASNDNTAAFARKAA